MKVSEDTMMAVANRLKDLGMPEEVAMAPEVMDCLFEGKCLMVHRVQRGKFWEINVKQLKGKSR